MLGNDGKLYGATRFALYRTAADGSLHEVVHTLALDGSEGRDPNTLIQASDGKLYGTTQSGGKNAGGTIFKLSPDGTGFTVLRALSQSDGVSPSGGLIERTNGYLVGAVRSAGPAGGGNLFRITKDGSYYSPDLVFGPVLDLDWLGYTPVGGILLASDGELYGTTSDGGAYNQGTVFSTRRDGIYHAILWHFQRADLNGNMPLAALMQASDGRLYGTTSTGGQHHLGTVFSVNPDGSDFQVLRHTTTSPNSNGIHPKAPMIEGTDGRLYGTTVGVRSSGRYFGGSIYCMNKDGTGYSVLRLFAGAPADGESPESALVPFEDGRLFGTTRTGGAYTNGTIFALSSDGSGYAQLRSFNGTNGAEPNGLTKGSDGILYGTTRGGGNVGLGTVFRIHTNATGHTILRHFGTGSTDAQHPNTSLLEGSDGVLYGTAAQIGNNVAGAIFRITKDGNDYRVLRRFGNSQDDGNEPVGTLVEGGDGVLYGATAWGGANGLGTVYRLRKDGSAYRVLCSLPIAALSLGGLGVVEGRDGALYGINYEDGDFGYGTIYRFAVQTMLFDMVHTGGSYRFTFDARPDRIYVPEFKNHLADPNWSLLPQVLNVKGTVNVTDTNITSNARYYRVSAQ
jgi:uncharacterized repeat protein (TIGR03803 family)